MAFKKKSETFETVAVLTLPLKCSDGQRRRLDHAFRAGNDLNNLLIADRLKVLKQLERTKIWKKNQKRLSYCYRTIPECEDALNEIRGKRGKEFRPRRKELKRKLADAKKMQSDCLIIRKLLLEESGLTSDAFEKRITALRRPFTKLVHSQAAEKISADVWKSFDSYLYGNGKAVHFSSWKNFTWISVKQAGTGIIYQDGFVKFQGMSLRVKLDRKDKYRYQTEALSRKIHFCSLTRRWYPSGWKYFLQITYGGSAPVKIDPETGEPLHSLGKGRVGNDIGPQTLATVGDEKAHLCVLAESVQNIENRLRRINRAMDRSRRAMNPGMFSDDGQVIPIGQ